MMPIIWETTEQAKADVENWTRGGPVTPAVEEAVTKNGLTFTAVWMCMRVKSDPRNN